MMPGSVSNGTSDRSSAGDSFVGDFEQLGQGVGHVGADDSGPQAVLRQPLPQVGRQRLFVDSRPQRGELRDRGRVGAVKISSVTLSAVMQAARAIALGCRSTSLQPTAPTAQKTSKSGARMPGASHQREKTRSDVSNSKGREGHRGSRALRRCQPRSPDAFEGWAGMLA